MNAIALFLMLVLNGNMTCGAEIPSQTLLSGQMVQLEVYGCYWGEQDHASHQFVVISPVCPTYVALPILIKEMHSHKRLGHEPLRRVLSGHYEYRYG